MSETDIERASDLCVPRAPVETRVLSRLGSVRLVACPTRPPCDGCLSKMGELARPGDRATCPLCIGLLKAELAINADAALADYVMKHALPPTEDVRDKISRSALEDAITSSSVAVRQTAFLKTSWTRKRARQWMILNGFSALIERSTADHWVFSKLPGHWLDPETIKAMTFQTEGVKDITLITGDLLEEYVKEVPETSDFRDDSFPEPGVRITKAKRVPGTPPTKDVAPAPEVVEPSSKIDPLISSIAKSLGVDPDKAVEQLWAGYQDLSKSRSVRPYLVFDKQTGLLKGRVDSHGHTHEIYEEINPQAAEKGGRVYLVSGVGHGHAHSVDLDFAKMEGTSSEERDPISVGRHTHDFDIRHGTVIRE